MPRAKPAKRASKTSAKPRSRRTASGVKRRAHGLQVDGVLTVAVATDFHAYDELDAGKRPSHLCVTSPESEPTQHPMSGLYYLINQESLKADILLLGGDFGHKARPAGIQYAWQKSQDLAKALDVSFTAATSGNHDLDSRYGYTKFDAKGVLQTLRPHFPLANEIQCDRYWARHFVIVHNPPYRLVILNSSAFHGTAPDEIAHGRISDHTLEALQTDLDATTTEPVNILLCHHHPQQHMELRLGDYDVMKNGQLLLDLLGSGKYGRWLIIHGHKHHPKLTYASGSASAPVVFSAGSLCAELYLELQTRARNQFYMLSLPYSKFSHFGCVGIVNAWDWSTGIGWIRAGASSGLPWRSGFGCRTDATLLAAEIARHVGTFMSWQDVLGTVPAVDFLLPQDERILSDALRDQHNLHIARNTDGVPVQIGVGS